jgi:hypothetical protein
MDTATAPKDNIRRLQAWGFIVFPCKSRNQRSGLQKLEDGNALMLLSVSAEICRAR